MSDKAKVGKQKHLGIIDDSIRQYEKCRRILGAISSEVRQHGRLTDEMVGKLLELTHEFPQIMHYLGEMRILIIEAKEDNVVRAEDKFERRTGNG